MPLTNAPHLAGVVTATTSGASLSRMCSAGEPPLTQRETEVLDLAAEGAPVAEIARRAALSQGTVRNYLSSAAAKPGAENRHTAARMARERGWL